MPDGYPRLYVPDRQPPVPGEPRQGPLDRPAVSAEPLGGVDAPARDPHRDPAPVQKPPAARDVVRLVGVKLGGAFAALPRGLPDPRHGVDQGLEHHAVVAVRAGQEGRQRNPLPIRDYVPFCARLAAIGGVRADGGAPLLAGRLALSRQARDQSMRSASPRRSRSTRWRRSYTPATCQSRNRRQQVTPDQQPVWTGRYSQGMPVLSTRRMPVNAARSGTRGRPPWSMAGSGAAAGRRSPTIRRKGVACSWPRSTTSHPVLKGALNRGAIGCGATRCLGEDAAAVRLGQSIDLEVKGLIAGRDPGTTNIHVLIVSKRGTQCT